MLGRYWRASPWWVRIIAILAGVGVAFTVADAVFKVIGWIDTLDSLVNQNFLIHGPPAQIKTSVTVIILSVTFVSVFLVSLLLARRHVEIQEVAGGVAVPSAKLFGTLVNAFGYRIDKIRKTVEVDRHGGASITFQHTGLKPIVGVTDEVTHSIVVSAPDADVAEESFKFEMDEKQSSVPYRTELRTITHHEKYEECLLVVCFLEGLDASDKNHKRGCSYTYWLKMPKAYCMTLEELVRAGTSRGLQKESSSVIVNKPYKELEIIVNFPHDFPASDFDFATWPVYAVAPPNLKLTQQFKDSAGYDLSRQVVEVEGRKVLQVRLTILSPLIGFSYAIVWTPPSEKTSNVSG